MLQVMLGSTFSISLDNGLNLFKLFFFNSFSLGLLYLSQKIKRTHGFKTCDDFDIRK